MFEKVDRALGLLKEAVAELEPEVLEARSAAKLAQDFGYIERLGAAGKALAARRVADSGVWKRDGSRSPGHWLAKRTGESVGKAVSTIETAQRLSELPQTEAAVRRGKLSETQSKEIASAAALNPSSEKDLLRVARAEGMGTLKQACARVKAASGADEKERYARIFKSRYLRHYTDREGAFRLDAKLTPDAGAVVVAALEPFKDKVFQEARKQGRRESYDCYAADALVAMANDARAGKGGSRKGPGALVRVLVDHKSLKRGHTEPGEICEIEGVGPIPVATADSLARDSFIAVLETDGTAIQAVSHMGRQVTARQRSALEVRDQCCVVGGCDVRDHLEIDHVTGRKENGPTKLENLARLCPWHHYLKTYKDYRLTGGPGNWRFDGPNGAGPDP
ncbi:MAG TPA: DUF222 domain-containing protein [Actinomycetota bacterium]|nr:DUF222 domain-containing protein [Actinomycetota bacterium]